MECTYFNDTPKYILGYVKIHLILQSKTHVKETLVQQPNVIQTATLKYIFKLTMEQCML